MKRSESTDIQPCESCVTRSRSVFCGSDPEKLRLICELRESKVYRKGQILPFVIDGEEGFHVVQQGKLKVWHLGKKPRAIQISGPGEIVGYSEWKDPAHAAEAIEDVTTCFFPKARFWKSATRNPSLTQDLVAWLCKALRTGSMRIANLESGLVRRQVANVLLELSTEFGMPSELGTKIDLRLDRRTLAELSGTVVETLARNLTELEKGGAIARDGWEIHVTDATKLRKFAED